MTAHPHEDSRVLLCMGFVASRPLVQALAPSQYAAGSHDHLVPRRQISSEGIDGIEQRLGIKATPGGQHPGLGTRNALVALGPTSYLEIIGPDPDQPKPAGPRRFGIDDLTAPRIVRWVVKSDALDAVSARAAKAGITLGAVTSGSRRRPDGVVLSCATRIEYRRCRRLAPFTDWARLHIRRRGPRRLLCNGAEHPDADRAQQMLGHLAPTRE
jgi:hypothetical protein